MGNYAGTTLGIMKGNIRNLDFSSYEDISAAFGHLV